MELSGNLPTVISQKFAFDTLQIALSHYIQIMLNRLQSHEKQEQTLDNHKQIILHTIMKKVLFF